MYAVATIPLICSLSIDVQQSWYADYVSAVGNLTHLRGWWDGLLSRGPAFGYHANALKTWLVTKEQHLAFAEAVIKGTGVNITSVGRSHLEAHLVELNMSRNLLHRK